MGFFKINKNKEKINEQIATMSSTSVLHVTGITLKKEA